MAANKYVSVMMAKLDIIHAVQGLNISKYKPLKHDIIHAVQGSNISNAKSKPLK